MGSFSDYLEQSLVSHVFGASSWSAPSNWYLALCTADPTDAGTGASMNEVSNSNNYARAAITFSAASSRATSNSGIVTFNQASGSWGTVTHWAVVDANTYGTGNMLAYGSFSPTRSIVNGNTPAVQAAAVQISVDSGTMSTYLANALLNLAFRGTAYTKPDIYAALTTAVVAESDSGSTITEVSGNSYARVQINKAGGSSPAWNAPSGGATSNKDQVNFVTPTGSWGTVTTFALLDASTSGNLLYFYNPLADQAVQSGDLVYAAAGSITVSLA